MSRTPSSRAGTGGGAPDSAAKREGPLSRAFAWTVVHLRLLFVLAWIAAAVLTTAFLPSADEAQGSSLSSLVPRHSAAVAAEEEINRLFDYPLFSRIQIVQRAPGGLSRDAQARVISRAVDLDTGKLKQRYPSLLGAIPVLNTARLMPGSRESSTTAVTYLFVDPNLDIYAQRAAAEDYARAEVSRPDDHLVGVTGAIPARAEEGDRVTTALPWVELATIALIALMVGVHFRSVGAPLLTLVAAGVAYLVTMPVLVWLGRRTGTPVPQEIEPLVVVLLLGIVTDYSIFFLSGMRARLAEGRPPVLAAKSTAGELARIILTAGMVVVAATAALVMTSLTFFRALGPGLAITVTIGLLVSVTFVPAMMGLLGRALFWPTAPPRATVPVSPAAGSRPLPLDAESRAAPETPAQPAARTWRATVVRAVTVKPVAAAVAVVILGGLMYAASFLRDAGLGISLTDELPANAEAARAADAAGRGFAPGITSPSEIVVQRDGITSETSPLARLTLLVSKEPGVAGVVGPGTLPPRVTPSVFLAQNGSAARMAVFLSPDPLGVEGLEALRHLQARMPSLVNRAGLPAATFGIAGDSALAGETVDRTVDALGAIVIAALVADFVLLAIFLRALVAPLYLLATSGLVVAASLGLTALVFQARLGHPGLTYYVPFAAAVLLLALGSDYNVFVVGRIWQEAKAMPLREAIRVAAPRAGRAIGVAGLALAGSFALLAVIPLVPFREFAFAMAVGVLIDSFVVRSLLVPALMTLFGRASHWPGGGPSLPEPQPERSGRAAAPEARATRARGGTVRPGQSPPPPPPGGMPEAERPRPRGRSGAGPPQPVPPPP